MEMEGSVIQLEEDEDNDNLLVEAAFGRIGFEW
jgi:hypothetical protein